MCPYLIENLKHCENREKLQVGTLNDTYCQTSTSFNLDSYNAQECDKNQNTFQNFPIFVNYQVLLFYKKHMNYFMALYIYIYGASDARA